MSLILYTNPMSRGRIVRWALEEIGEPYEARNIAYGPEMKTPEFIAINPMGKIPVLDHDGAIITETPAIIAYLADAFPAAQLAPPPGSPARAAYYRWLFYAAGPVEAAMTNKALGAEVPAEKSGFVGYGSHPMVVDALEQLVAKASPYLLGAAFSALDIYLGSQIGFGLRFGNLESRPGFADYLGRIMARPSCRRAARLDDAGLPPARTPEPDAIL